jgi:HPt (histidine-containing phosphotransfer) domain-containing protein
MTEHTEAAAPQPVTLDCDQALNHAGGDPELLIQLCRIFLGELPLRMERLHRAIAARDLLSAGCALVQLQSCIMVFGSGQASCTAQTLENAIRNRRSRQIKREWIILEAQLRNLVPQVQCLMLEMVTPQTIQ